MPKLTPITNPTTYYLQHEGKTLKKVPASEYRELQQEAYELNEQAYADFLNKKDSGEVKRGRGRPRKSGDDDFSAPYKIIGMSIGDEDKIGGRFPHERDDRVWSKETRGKIYTGEPEENPAYRNSPYHDLEKWLAKIPRKLSRENLDKAVNTLLKEGVDYSGLWTFLQSHFYLTPEELSKALRQYGVNTKKIQQMAKFKMPNPRKRNSSMFGSDGYFNSDKLETLSAEFQGQITNEEFEAVSSDIAPKELARLGELVLIKTKNGHQIDFNKDAYLCADARKNLWCVGKGAKIRVKNGDKPRDGEMLILGEIEQIDYITDKQHIEEGRLTHYFHELGEVDGQRPTLAIDKDGFPLILGGNYDIWSAGIVN